MYIATALLCLICFLPQTQTEDPKIALIVREQTVIVKKSEALRLAKSEDLNVRAAAQIALGTVPDSLAEFEIELLTPQEAERFRWVRAPLQGRN